MGSLVQIQSPRPFFSPMPALLLTNDDGVHASGLGALAQALAELRVLVTGLPKMTLLNVNVPGAPPRGIRLTRLGHRVYREKIVEQTDPRGRTHYWIGAGEPEWEELRGTDMGALHEGYVSITPLHLDLTDHRALDALVDFGGSLDAQYRGATRKAARRK